MLAILGVSFLTPYGALFALAALVPLAALAVAERRSERVRAVLRLRGPGRRALAPVAGALVILPALVAVAAAQPVVVHRQLVHERGDAQAFFVLDTSRSMDASSGPGKPTRILRAKRLARRLEAALADVPVGLASMTDRVLPDLMPTTDPELFNRTMTESVGIDEPPPSQPYGKARATNMQSLLSLESSHFFTTGVQRRLVVVFTDGEASSDLRIFGYQIGHQLRPVFVHVWVPGERIYRHGVADPNYRADPTSTALLERAAKLSDGTVVGDAKLGPLLRAARRIVGHGPVTGHINAYARVALAPWVALMGVLPLGFLFYRRNF
jgi:von Willebrand factor type A domain